MRLLYLPKTPLLKEKMLTSVVLPEERKKNPLAFYVLDNY